MIGLYGSSLSHDVYNSLHYNHDSDFYTWYQTPTINVIMIEKSTTKQRMPNLTEYTIVL